MPSPQRVVIVGAGARGNKVFANLIATMQTGFELAAVVEPDAERREAFCQAYGIPAERAFAHVDAFLAAPRCGDIAFICTPDPVHFTLCKAVSEKGYDVLLEKPIATSLADTLALLAVERACHNRIIVAHVLRYAPFFQAVRRLARSGDYGPILHVDLREHVGHWHFAHSYVRGNWRRAGDSAPIILTKSSHDLDLLAWIVGKPPMWVSSYGSLLYFNTAHAPEGATDRCVDCPHQDTCLYSATRFYVNESPQWPFHVVSPVHDSMADRRKSIETGPYGRCVYRNDNDVCDHQVVALEFADGVLATFGLHAHTADNTRKITVLLEKAEIEGDLRQQRLTISHFTGEKDVLRIEEVPLGPPTDSHGGGDLQLLLMLYEHLTEGKHRELITSLESSVTSHVLAFLAEDSRVANGGRVRVPEVADVIDPANAPPTGRAGSGP